MKNYKLLSEIRTELGFKLDIQSVQKVLAAAWGCYMSDRGKMMEDATCYESYIRYPTDAKLLWGANEWGYKQIKVFRKVIKKRMPWSKFGEQKSKQIGYSKRKRKPSGRYVKSLVLNAEQKRKGHSAPIKTTTT